MTFSNETALKAALVAVCVGAVSEVEGRVYEEFHRGLDKYYGEFTPAEYIRTGALMGSLESTGAIQTGNGAIAEVYFSEPSYNTGTWSGAQVLDSAMSGSHGGYVGGTPIWGDSMARLGGEAGIKAMLMQELRSRGL